MTEQNLNLIDEVKRRRTFAIISHPDAGKTTLTEKFLLYGGAIREAGSVKSRRSQKHAVSDWMEIEKQRGISVASSVLQFEYNNFCINILDTPGHQDFSEDTYRTLMAADSAVMVIDSAKGVEDQTKKLFHVCKMRGIPIFTFINKMDRQGKDPFELMEDIENVLGIRSCPVNWPIGSGKEFKGVFNRHKNQVEVFNDGNHGQSIANCVTGEPSDEKITKKYAKNLCEETFDKLAVAIFINDHPQPRRLAPGIKDEMFIRGKVPMTKEEVRMVVIAKLGIQEDTGLVKYDQNSGQCMTSNPAPVIYDVGAGTGSVSIELSLLTEQGTVYAIEKKPEAVELLHANREKFHVGNMEILAGEASEVIPTLPAPTHVFIGGNGGNLFKIMDQIYAKNPNARIVLTAVTLETQAEMLTLADIAKRHNVDFNMVQMAVTRSREAGPYHMMQAQNPVWIVTMG